MQKKEASNPLYPHFMEGEWSGDDSGEKRVDVSCLNGEFRINVQPLGLGDHLVKVLLRCTTETADDTVIFYTWIGTISVNGDPVQVSGLFTPGNEKKDTIDVTSTFAEFSEITATLSRVK